MSSPIVTGLKKNVLLNMSIAASELFTAFDDDDAIEYFYVQDFNTSPSSGYFTFNGAAIAQGTLYKLASTDLSKLQYVAGNQISFDKIRIVAQDVAGNVNLGLTTAIVYSVRPNTTTPFSKAETFYLVANESIEAWKIVKGFDPDGYPIESYSIRDRNNDSGYFELNGVAKQQGSYFTISADDILNLRYVTTGQTSSEFFDVIAYDGAENSRNSVGVANTIINANAPNVRFTRGTVGGLAPNVRVADFMDVVDADNNTMKKYQFYNTSPHLENGDLVFKGVVQPRVQWIDVDASELNQMMFDAPNKNFTQQIRVRAFDGKFWSNSGTVAITSVFTPPPPPIIKPVYLSNKDVVVSEQLRSIPLSSMFSKADTGMPYVSYEIYDPDNNPARGYFAINGIPLAGGQVRQLTPLQFANATFVTGAFFERSLDSIYVRANNNQLWGDWEKLDIRTEPEVEDVLIGGSDWTGILNRNVNGDLVIPFSFMQQFPNYATGEAIDGDPLVGEHFSTLTVRARENVRLMFRHLEGIANLQFIEVADTSTNLLGGTGGIIRMGVYGIPSPTSSAGAFAFLPSTAPQGGDIWLNRLNFGPPSNLNLNPGTYGGFVFLHELGHAMGLKHPHQGTPRLPAATDVTDFSVMSYQNSPLGYTTTYQLYDISTLQGIYGANNNFNSGDNAYSLFRTWNNNQNFTATIWDGGGNDVLSGIGSTLPTILDLRGGQRSTIGAQQGNLGIAFDAIIENAIGSDLDDKIYGNAANNYLMGGKGNDYLFGGVGDDILLGAEGDDTFEFGVGEGYDMIFENGLGGLDTLKITPFDGLTLLEDDFRFRLAGNDLVVNLSLNQGASQGKVRIRNQTQAGSQVETLELNGVRIDLENLTSQAVSNEKRFQVLTTSSANGFLVAPV